MDKEGKNVYGRIPALKEHELKVRILMLGSLGFLLSIKSDRRFPFPETLSEPVFQVLLIPLTLCFFIAIFYFLKPGIFTHTFSFLNRISSLRLAIAISLIFQGMILVLLVVQDMQYASFGYVLLFPIAVLLFAATGLVFGYIFMRESAPNLFFSTALIAYAGTYLLSIVSFPLNPARSDMLPLIVSGGRSFLSGDTLWIPRYSPSLGFHIPSGDVASLPSGGGTRC